MRINKQADVSGAAGLDAESLAAINALARKTLTEDEVYTFGVRLCDNEVDRDGERFPEATLEELAKLFVGKSGVFDHQWSARGQTARIYRTEVVREDGAEFIKAWAYIRRGDANDEIIADIEAGIKKEVSVGCAMGRSVCSICGSDYGSCGHRKGESYDGQVCCAILQEPMDAYEFSFVAVPAQREAGVLKGLGCGKPKLKELADEFGAQAEYRALYQQAELGKRYQKELEDSIVRLGLSLELGVEAPVLRSIARTAAAEDLIKLKSALEERLAESMPLTTQLGGCRG